MNWLNDFLNTYLGQQIAQQGVPLLQGALTYIFNKPKADTFFDDQKVLNEVNTVLSQIGLNPVQSFEELNQLQPEDKVLKSAVNKIKNYVKNYQQLKQTATIADIGQMMTSGVLGKVAPENALKGFADYVAQKQALISWASKVGIPPEIIALYDLNPLLALLTIRGGMGGGK